MCRTIMTCSRVLFFNLLYMSFAYGAVYNSSEFCNTSHIAVDVDTQSLKGLVFSPGYPADYGNNSQCQINITGLPHLAWIKMELHQLNSPQCDHWGELPCCAVQAINFSNSKTNLSTCTPHEKIYQTEGDMIFTLPSKSRMSASFFISFEIYPAFTSRVKPGSRREGYIGYGSKYTGMLADGPPEDDSNSTRPQTGFYVLPSGNSTTFQPPKPIFYATLKSSYKWTSSVKFDIMQLNVGHTEHPHQGFNTEYPHQGFSLRVGRRMDETYHLSNGTSYLKELRVFVRPQDYVSLSYIHANSVLEADEGFIMKFIIESCDEEIENVQSLEGATSRDTAYFQIQCADGYVSPQLVYKCDGDTWLPRKPQCISLNPENKGEEGEEGSQETTTTNDDILLSLVTPLALALGISLVLLFLALIYLLITLKRRSNQISDRKRPTKRNMVDVVVPRETVRNVLSLRSSSLTPIQSSGAGVPVESGAVLDPNIPSPPLTPHPNRRFSSTRLEDSAQNACSVQVGDDPGVTSSQPWTITNGNFCQFSRFKLVPRSTVPHVNYF